MSFGIKEIENILHDIGFETDHIHAEDEHGAFHLPEDIGEGYLSVYTSVVDKLRHVVFSVPDVARLRQKNREQLLLALMEINYKQTVCHFSVDPDDGVVNLNADYHVSEDDIDFSTELIKTVAAVMIFVLQMYCRLPKYIGRGLSTQDAIAACRKEMLGHALGSNEADVRVADSSPLPLHVHDQLRARFAGKHFKLHD